MSSLKQTAGMDSTKDMASISKDPAIQDFAIKDISKETAVKDSGPTSSGGTQANSVTKHFKGLGISTMDDENSESDDDNEDGGVSIEGIRIKGIKEFNGTADDEGGIDTEASPAGHYKSNSSSKGSSKPYSPGAYGSGFVCHGAGSRHDDPFSSPSKKTVQHGHGKVRSINTTPTKRLDQNWRSGSSGGSSGGDSPAHDLKAAQQHQSSGHKGGQFISGQNAQAFYPPSACVFVANLLSTEDEAELETAVTMVFKEYGPVYVKIRRDSKNMPFAFCQYTRDDQAARAIQEGRGKIIHGRPCRTERAKANRVYFMSRKDAGAFEWDAEVGAAAGQYGEISDHWIADNRVQAMSGIQGLLPGHFVEYKFYESGRDAQIGMRDPKSIFEMGTPHLPDTATPRNNNARSSPRGTSVRSFLKEYAIDRDSVFVGNLPNESTSEQIAEMFAPYGEILDINLHQLPSTRPGCHLNVFCFIQFTNPVGALLAIESLDGYRIDQAHTLRVKQKDSGYGNSLRARRSAGHDHSRPSYQSATPARSGGNAIMTTSTPMQDQQHVNGPYPPTPVSQGFSAGCPQPGYNVQPGWAQMSTMPPAGSPVQNYFGTYYPCPVYPTYNYQYATAADYYAAQAQTQTLAQAQAPQQYLHVGGYGYGYPTSAPQYVTDTNSNQEPASIAPAGLDQGSTGAEQDIIAEQ